MMFAILTLLAGLLTVWLLAVGPAGIVTLAKGNSSCFRWGFLTFGLTWFGGAIALAPPDSHWARHRYDADRRRRAALPLGSQRSPWVLALWPLVAILAIAFTGLFIARPAPILGVNGAALEHALPHGGFSSRPCAKVAGGYRCLVETPERSGDSTEYRVHLQGHGCWRAVPESAEGRRGWGVLSGCLTLLDYARPFGLRGPL
jgi:hypothetical protein